MLLFDILRGLFEAQTIANSANCIPATPGGPSACPASAFHAVTAAFATQGYWVQADILYYLTNTGLETWAILVYVLSAIAGIISMAMGFPPKLYLMYFVGPALYHWLVQDTVPVLGVRWNVGPEAISDPDRQERAQREVWKLAEAGLTNTNIVREGIALIDSPIGDLGGFFGSTVGKVRVSNVFLWYDVIMTDLVEWFMDWTGVFYLGSSGNSILSDAASSLPNEVVRTAGAAGVIGGQDNDRSDDQHWSLSTLKWQYLQDITGAQLHSGNLRDAFVTFLQSECGDALEQGLDEASYVAAGSAKGANIPPTVFAGPTTFASEVPGSPTTSQYTTATERLATTSIPTPNSLLDLMTEDGEGSFYEGFPFLQTDEFNQLNAFEVIRCDQYFYLLVQGFRWEAGHHYYQMISGLPAGINPTTLLYTLFYGWTLRDLEGDNLFDTGFLQNIFSQGTLLGTYTPDGQAAFLTDLILVHLIRNELALAPAPYEARQSAGGDAKTWLRTYVATLGSKQKFGEIYTWATLLPYVQGVLLYLLAIAYPFVCIFILVPGWHKIIFTWMTFWAWVKLWDIGFAIVVVLERSVWAMLGNNSDAVKLFSRVWSMQDDGRVRVECPSSLVGFALDPPYAVCQPGAVPNVVVGEGLDGTGRIGWLDTLRIFDKSLTVGPAMDLDLSNGWYIYIMSALYFAVPAVTGQIVLGAKSGAASLATQAIQGAAQDSSKGVSSGHTGELTNRVVANSASVAQAAYARAHRADAQGYALGALGFGNLGLQAETSRDAASTASSSLGQLSRIASLNRDSRNDALSAGTKILGAAAGLGQESGKALSNFGGGLFRSADNFMGRLSGNGGASGSPAAGIVGGIGDATAFAISAFNTAMSVPEAVGRYAIGEQYRQNQIQYDAQQSQMGVNGFTYGGQARGYNQAAQRNKSAAEQSAAEARWQAQRDYANQVSGYIGAQGVKDGAVTPSSKPMDFDGMSFTGALGGDLQQQAQYSDPNKGDYQNWLYGMSGDMQAAYGWQSAMDRYAPAGIGYEMSQALDQGGNAWQLFAQAGDLSAGSFSQAFGDIAGRDTESLKAAQLGFFQDLNAVTPLYTPASGERAPPDLNPPAQFLNPFTTPSRFADAA